MEVAVIADELTALGWRLIGAEVLLATAENVEECLDKAQHSAEVVVITAGLAAKVSAVRLQAVLQAFPPLMLVIADLEHTTEPPDLETQARRALGVMP
jgi:vacuolar-type H+-ATPase subunit F/Vma7